MIFGDIDLETNLLCPIYCVPLYLIQGFKFNVSSMENMIYLSNINYLSAEFLLLSY